MAVDVENVLEGSVEETLRQRKKARTRRALVEAAAGLFAERGYTATTVQEIAAAADISPRTFFRYFPTKEDVVFADFDDAFDRWAEAFHAGPVGEPLEAALRRATLAVNAAYEADREELDRVQALLVSEPSLALRALAFDRAAVERAAGLIAEALGLAVDRDPRPRAIAAAAMGAVRAAIAVWEAGGRRAERADAVGTAYDLLADLPSTLRLPRR